MFQVMYHTCTQPTPPGPGSLAPRPAAAASAQAAGGADSGLAYSSRNLDLLPDLIGGP
jgi:hypothetical protein